MILPIADGRWLLWQGGQLRLWRTIGEAWRKPVGDPGTRALDAQLVLDGRLFVLAQQRDGSTPRGGELRLSVAARHRRRAARRCCACPQVDQLAIAARRGLAVARTGDRLGVFDLRFGRWVRDLVLPAGTPTSRSTTASRRIALGTADGLELVRADALASPVATPTESDAERRPRRARAGEDQRPLGGAVETVGAAATAGSAAATERARAPESSRCPTLRSCGSIRSRSRPTATRGEVAQSIELRLQLVGARVYLAIAEAWDCGRIVKPDPTSRRSSTRSAACSRIVERAARGRRS